MPKSSSQSPSPSAPGQESTQSPPHPSLIPYPEHLSVSDKLIEAFRSISLTMIIGFGILWVLILAPIYNPFVEQFANSSNNPFSTFHFNILLTLGFIVTVFVMGARAESTGLLIWNFKFQVIVALAATFGLVLNLAAALLFNSYLFIAGIIVSAASTALILLTWGDVYVRQEPPAVVINAILGIIFGFAVFAILDLLVDRLVSNILCCFLPLVQLSMLVISSKKIRTPLLVIINSEKEQAAKHVASLGPLGEIPKTSTLRIRKSTFALAIGAPALFFGLALGPLSEQVFSSLLSGTMLASSLFVYATIACLLAFIIIIISIVLQDREYDSFYRILIPFIAVAMLLAPFFVIENAAVSLICYLVGYLGFELMMWIEFSEICHRYRISSLLVFGFGRGFLAIGMQISIYLIHYSPFDLISNGDNNFMLSLIIIVFILVGYSVLPRERTIRYMAMHGRPEKQWDSNEDDAETKQGRFIRSCNQIADDYLLSKRETEVFHLLAKGRNAAFIAENLFISIGTVHTHTWRIYRKLSIHSQHDLMGLVDQSVYIKRS